MIKSSLEVDLIIGQLAIDHPRVRIVFSGIPICCSYPFLWYLDNNDTPCPKNRQDSVYSTAKRSSDGRIKMQCMNYVF